MKDALSGYVGISTVYASTQYSNSSLFLSLSFLSPSLSLFLPVSLSFPSSLPPLFFSLSPSLPSSLPLSLSLSLSPSLSSLYRLVSVDDKDINFWEILQDFAEKMFLIPTIPEGTLGLEILLPGFSSVSRIMPPRQSKLIIINIISISYFVTADEYPINHHSCL